MVDSKKIVKNSMWLYLRMIIVTVVTLYTSRLVLESLGIDDFAIYNVTSSLVAFLSVLSTSMSNATQRFLNVKKGMKDFVAVARILSLSISIHKLLGLLLFVLAETVGVYFVLYVIEVPELKRMEAFWCYQTSILALVYTFAKIPYMAVIITYERFSFVAFTSLFDVVVKLLMVFALDFLPSYRIVYYGLSFAVMAIVQFYMYKTYSIKYVKAQSIKLTEVFKSAESKELLSFSSWNILGSVSNVFANQGIMLVLNLFYKLSVNAAIGITNQVTNTIASFIANVQQAFRPQLLQSYADKEKQPFYILLYSASRWSYMAMLLIAIPLICNISYVLKLWLGTYPDYTDSFVMILMVYLLIDSLGTPLVFAIEANGKIKRFQIVLSILYGINLLVAWMVCKTGFSPNIVILTKSIVNMFILLLKVYEFKRVDQNFSIVDYAKHVIVRLMPMTLMCLIFVYYVYDIEQSFVKLISSTLIFGVIYTTLVYLLGVTKNERAIINRKILKYVKTI